MAQKNAAKLYTPRLLALSTQLASYPLADSQAHRAEVRSRTCGSVIELGVDCAPSGEVDSLGMNVTACAIGQSSAAIMAMEAQGRSTNSFMAMLTAIEQWLADDTAPLPEWPGFDALEPARHHKGRHGALLLPWSAMTQALSSQGPSR